MKKTEIISIVLGKKESTNFNRYTFPILNRPVVMYPLLAVKNNSLIDKIYLSTDSSTLLSYVKSFEGITVLERKKSQPTLTQEIKIALKKIKKDHGYYPELVNVIFANSPCVTSDLLFNAFSYLLENPECSSVVTAMRRSEFSPARMFTLKEDLLLQDKKFLSFHENVYFLDHRIIVTRIDNILSLKEESSYIESILGKNIHPFIQQEGIWDIDYIWQIPMVERWLKNSGFTDTTTPYDKAESAPRVSLPAKKQKNIKNNRYKILITTVPFGNINPLPLKILEEMPNVEYIINPLGRKLKEDELAGMIHDFDIIIAGTEPITRKVMENGRKLKLISRVGIGLDSVDLLAARELGIKVSYTPDAPAPAVAELTVGQMINMLRKIPLVDRKLRSGIWQRIHGERLSNAVIGIIGTGRVGSRVLKHLQGFNPRKILVNDLAPNHNLYDMYHAEHVEKESIYRDSDIITLHVPLTKLTKNMITSRELGMMKKSVSIINTSRGGIINENDIYDALLNNKITAAALDVFEDEPYAGKLTELDNCFLTCHMGSMTKDCRSLMELLATQEALRFINDEPLIGAVPAYEYEIVLDLLKLC